MAKAREERFPGNSSISEFEAYLKDMRKKIRKKIDKGLVKDPEKAEGFAKLIDSVLNRLIYFEQDINVFTLMTYLKEDYQRLGAELAQYEKLAKEAKAAVEECVLEPEVDPSYIIPDEWKQQREARQKKLAEAREELHALESVIQELKYEQQLINKLQGMVCRPKGFFAKL